MSKKNLIYLGVFVFLFLVAIMARDPFKSQNKNNIFRDIAMDRVDKIEIINGDTTTFLEKSVALGDANWKIGETKNFYVDPFLKNELDNLLLNLKTVKFDLVSENEINKLELVNETGIQVRFYEGDNLLKDFQVGKLGADYPSTYISKSDSDVTYMVNLDLFNVFSSTNWHDKNLTSLNSDSINKIRIQHKDQVYTLELNYEGVWSANAPTKLAVKQEKIIDLLESLHSFNAIEIPEQKFEGTGLEKNNLILQFTGEGIDRTLMVGDKKPETDKYYIKKGDSDNIYLITEEQKNILDIKIVDIR